MGWFNHQPDHVYPHSHLSHQLRSSPAGEVKCQSDRDSNVSWHHRNLNGKTSRDDSPGRKNVTDLRCLIEICFIWRGVRKKISCEEAFFWIDFVMFQWFLEKMAGNSKSTFSLAQFSASPAWHLHSKRLQISAANASLPQVWYFNGTSRSRFSICMPKQRLDHSSLFVKWSQIPRLVGKAPIHLGFFRKKFGFLLQPNSGVRKTPRGKEEMFPAKL